MKVETLLERMHQRTGVPWMVEEGHRPQGRQDHLWTIGRRGIPHERPVTWTRVTRWHGSGMAADLRPVAGYSCPHEWWDILFEEEQKLGLSDPPRKMGDLGHVQLSDEAMREKALAWVKAGFPKMPDTPVHTDPTPTATVNGAVLPIAPYSDADHWYTEVGSTLRALGITVTAKGPALFLRASDLRSLGFNVDGDAAGVRVTKL